MLKKVVNCLACNNEEDKRIRGRVVLMKKNVLDFNDFTASILDRVHEFVGQRVSLQLISATNVNPVMDRIINVGVFDSEAAKS
ncbi:hypothetical protein AHAS_Ahas06G0041100 [Arachis hypogaea]